MAIDGVAEQKEVDNVQGFWVLKQEDDDRGGTYPKVWGFLVPSFDYLFFTPDLGVVRRGFREHEGSWEIVLGEAVKIPHDMVLKIANYKRLKLGLDAWLKTVSPVSSQEK